MAKKLAVDPKRLADIVKRLSPYTSPSEIPLEAFKRAGVSRSAVFRLWGGKSGMRLETVARAARLLGVRLWEVLVEIEEIDDVPPAFQKDGLSPQRAAALRVLERALRENSFSFGARAVKVKGER